MNEKIKVEFWGDLICPMCPIGYVNLKKAIGQFPEKHNIDIFYHSFRLRPGVPPHSVDEYLKGNHGPDANVPQILFHVEEWGASAGLIYKMAKTKAGDTMDAHRVVHFANSKGMQMEAVDRIQQAHFAEEENIFDIDTLVRLAGDIGLDQDEVAVMLAGDLFKKEVQADQDALHLRGVSGVPYFLINDQIVIRGVQEPKAFLAAFNKIWKAMQTTAPAIQLDGMSCGPDNCAF